MKTSFRNTAHIKTAYVKIGPMKKGYVCENNIRSADTKKTSVHTKKVARKLPI